MLKNNKGFTVIELIMSFLFASILAISLFSVIISYRGKQTDTSIETDILAFKSQLIMDIQEEIQLKGLKSIDYCPGTEENTILARCVIIRFNNNDVKTFQISFEDKVDKITNNDGTESQFYFKIPYIVYGDIRYDIPDAANIYIVDDYILETTGPADGIESGTKLYKINFNLKHNDLDTNVNISLVASGSLADTSSTGVYRVFNVGEDVTIQLNSTYQRHFRVIQYSNSFKDDLVLLYDDVYDFDEQHCKVCNSTIFNIIDNISNRYNSSSIKNIVHDIEIEWKNADEVRLITAEEVARLSSLCPNYRGIDSIPVSINSTYSWLTNQSYWTMSEKLLSNADNGKKVWYVDGNNKTLSYDYVTEKHALRPVIVIKKSFVTNLH